jgi:hypothetical protein
MRICETSPPGLKPYKSSESLDPPGDGVRSTGTCAVVSISSARVDLPSEFRGTIPPGAGGFVSLRTTTLGELFRAGENLAAISPLLAFRASSLLFLSAAKAPVCFSLALSCAVAGRDRVFGLSLGGSAPLIRSDGVADDDFACLVYVAADTMVFDVFDCAPIRADVLRFEVLFDCAVGSTRVGAVADAILVLLGRGMMGAVLAV